MGYDGGTSFFPDRDCKSLELGAGNEGCLVARGCKVIGVGCGCIAFGVAWITVMHSSNTDRGREDAGSH